MKKSLMFSLLLICSLSSCKKEDGNALAPTPKANAIDINKTFKSVEIEISNLDCSTDFSADSSKAHGGVWDWKGVVKPLAYSTNRQIHKSYPELIQSDLRYYYSYSMMLCAGGSFADMFLLKLNSDKTEIDSLKVSTADYDSEFGPINERRDTESFDLIACNLKPSVVNDTMIRFDFTDSKLLNSIKKYCRLNTSYWNLEVSNSKGSYSFSYNPPLSVKPASVFRITFKY